MFDILILSPFENVPNALQHEAHGVRKSKTQRCWLIALRSAPLSYTAATTPNEGRRPTTESSADTRILGPPDSSPPHVGIGELKLPLRHTLFPVMSGEAPSNVKLLISFTSCARSVKVERQHTLTVLSCQILFGFPLLRNGRYS